MTWSWVGDRKCWSQLLLWQGHPHHSSPKPIGTDPKRTFKKHYSLSHPKESTFIAGTCIRWLYKAISFHPLGITWLLAGIFHHLANELAGRKHRWQLTTSTQHAKHAPGCTQKWLQIWPIMAAFSPVLRLNHWDTGDLCRGSKGISPKVDLAHSSQAWESTIPWAPFFSHGVGKPDKNNKKLLSLAVRILP